MDPEQLPSSDGEHGGPGGARAYTRTSAGARGLGILKRLKGLPSEAHELMCS